MRHLFKIIFALVVTSNVFAQQDAEYSMYFFNGLYLNPAYAGSKEVPHISGLYRHQWDGINGAPRSGSLSFHSPLKKDQYALGLNMTYDKLGVYQNKNIVGNFAYRIKTRGTTKISLGVSLSAANFTQWQGDALNPDPNNSTLNAWVPNVGLGVYVYNKKYYAGLSCPHILNTLLYDTLGFTSNTNIARTYNHYLLTAGYVFGKENSDVKFMPSALMKYVPGVSLQFDFTGNVILRDMLMLGLSYRTTGDNTNSKGESLIGIIKVALFKNLEIGYSYDYTLSQLSTINSGTHEIYLGYTFGGSNLKRVVTPRFVTYF
jgi:type IX secretion system PorP/SprF family membrane protein